MPVNLSQYRAAIGVFNNRNLITNKRFFYFTESNNVGMNLFPAINVMVFFFFFFMFVVSVHQKNRKIRFKLIFLRLLIIGFCLYHIWFDIHLVNLSGDVEKNHKIHKMDIVCFSETFLDSSVLIDDDNF